MVDVTKESLKAAGIKVSELAAVLGVHYTSISDMIGGRTSRPTPGTQAILWLWPQLSAEQRAALIAGAHLVAGDRSAE